MDNLKISKYKTVRERFSHLNDNEFIKFSNSRIKNSKRLITRDQNILDGNGTIKGRQIKVSNSIFFNNRIKENEKIINTWQDAINELEFDNKIIDGLKNAINSNLKYSSIEEVLFTSKYILSVYGGDSSDYPKDEEDEEVSYFIYAYESEKDFENGNNYSGGGLILKKSETLDDVQAKLEYIKSFVNIRN